MAENEILKTADFPSVIHNNEVSEEIVKWGCANSFPVKKAKLIYKLDAYVGFSPEYMIVAKRKPPIPGGWAVTVEKFVPEERTIPLNVNAKGEVNRFILKMMEEYEKEGLIVSLSDKVYNSYGSDLRDVTVKGHMILVNMFEDFVENMR